MTEDPLGYELNHSMATSPNPLYRRHPNFEGPPLPLDMDKDRMEITTVLGGTKRDRDDERRMGIKARLQVGDDPSHILFELTKYSDASNSHQRLLSHHVQVFLLNNAGSPADCDIAGYGNMGDPPDVRPMKGFNCTGMTH